MNKNLKYVIIIHKKPTISTPIMKKNKFFGIREKYKDFGYKLL